MRLRAVLRRHASIALDTCIFIYQLEGNARYVPLTNEIFAWLEQPGHRAVASTVTMTELLVQPYRVLGEDRAREIYSLAATYPNLQWISPDLEIAGVAARIRASFGLQTPDAIVAATAVHHDIAALITNDRSFRRLDLFETVVLDEFL